MRELESGQCERKSHMWPTYHIIHSHRRHYYLFGMSCHPFLLSICWELNSISSHSWPKLAAKNIGQPEEADNLISMEFLLQVFDTTSRHFTHPPLGQKHMLYNRRRSHNNNGRYSAVTYENMYFRKKKTIFSPYPPILKFHHHHQSTYELLDIRQLLLKYHIYCCGGIVSKLSAVFISIW